MGEFYGNSGSGTNNGTNNIVRSGSGMGTVRLERMMGLNVNVSTPINNPDVTSSMVNASGIEWLWLKSKGGWVKRVDWEESKGVAVGNSIKNTDPDPASDPDVLDRMMASNGIEWLKLGSTGQWMRRIDW